jgi:hypothetical protein
LFSTLPTPNPVFTPPFLPPPPPPPAPISIHQLYDERGLHWLVNSFARRLKTVWTFSHPTNKLAPVPPKVSNSPFARIRQLIDNKQPKTPCHQTQRPPRATPPSTRTIRATTTTTTTSKIREKERKNYIHSGECNNRSRLVSAPFQKCRQTTAQFSLIGF